MNLLRLIGIGLTLSVLSTPTRAQQIDGNELLETCKSENLVLAGFCLGYIIGYSEGAPWGAFLSFAQNTPGISAEAAAEEVGAITRSCVPANATNEQLRDVVTKHLVEHPAQRSESARFLVWKAYTEAFPC